MIDFNVRSADAAFRQQPASGLRSLQALLHPNNPLPIQLLARQWAADGGGVLPTGPRVAIGTGCSNGNLCTSGMLHVDSVDLGEHRIRVTTLDWAENSGETSLRLRVSDLSSLLDDAFGRLGDRPLLRALLNEARGALDDWDRQQDPHRPLGNTLLALHEIDHLIEDQQVPDYPGLREDLARGSIAELRRYLDLAFDGVDGNGAAAAADLQSARGFLSRALSMHAQQAFPEVYGRLLGALFSIESALFLPQNPVAAAVDLAEGLRWYGAQDHLAEQQAMAALHESLTRQLDGPLTLIQRGLIGLMGDPWGWYQAWMELDSSLAILDDLIGQLVWTRWFRWLLVEVRGEFIDFGRDELCLLLGPGPGAVGALCPNFSQHPLLDEAACVMSRVRRAMDIRDEDDVLALLRRLRCILQLAAEDIHGANAPDRLTCPPPADLIGFVREDGDDVAPLDLVPDYFVCDGAVFCPAGRAPVPAHLPPGRGGSCDADRFDFEDDCR